MLLDSVKAERAFVGRDKTQSNNRGMEVGNKCKLST